MCVCKDVRYDLEDSEQKAMFNSRFIVVILPMWIFKHNLFHFLAASVGWDLVKRWTATHIFWI